jgi:hypothetical protein
MTEPHDDVLDELRALVNIETTPGFEDRVRRQIEQPARPGRWWMGAVGLVSAAACVWFVMPRTRPAAPRPSDVRPGMEKPVARAVERVTTPVTPRTVPVPESVTPSASAGKRHAVSGATAREVLVPPDQALALQRLTAAIRSGQVIWAPSAGEDAPVVVEPLPDITPIKVELLPGTSDNHGTGTEPNSQRVDNHAPTQT